jgi:hypothetical protein
MTIVKLQLSELRSLIREALAGSRPEENYDNELAEDEAWKQHSVMVPDDVKAPINKWMKSMGLAGAKKKRAR